jgi:hypothetical protein
VNEEDAGVVFDGDGGLPTDGSTWVPDGTEFFSRGFRNMGDDVLQSIDFCLDKSR